MSVVSGVMLVVSILVGMDCGAASAQAIYKYPKPDSSVTNKKQPRAPRATGRSAPQAFPKWAPVEGYRLVFADSFDTGRLRNEWQPERNGGKYELVGNGEQFSDGGRCLRVSNECILKTVIERLPNAGKAPRWVMARAMIRSSGFAMDGRKFYEVGKFHLSYKPKGRDDEFAGEELSDPMMDWTEVTVGPLLEEANGTGLNLFVGIQNNKGNLWIDNVEVWIAEVAAASR